MKSRRCTIGFLFAMAVVVGCASTKVAEQTPMVKEAIARPDRIWVYDFVAAPADIPADSSIGSKVSAPSTPLTPEQIEVGRQRGALIAKDLVVDIQAMGLSAAQGTPGSSPQVGDGVIRS